MALAYLAGGWLLGLAAAALGLPGALAALLAGAGAAALAWRPALRTALLLLGALALALLGILRYQAAQPSPDPAGIARYNDRGPVRLRALVIADGEERGRDLRLPVAARQILWQGRWQPARGKALLTTSAAAPYRYGDLLEVQGELRTPPTLPGFDYREYLARQGIGSTLYRPQVRRLAEGQGNPAREGLLGLRRRLAQGLQRTLPEPQASLGQSLLLGMRRSLPPELTRDFNTTGLSHLLVVSGQNVTLVAGLVLAGLLGLLGRRRATVAAMAAVAAYALLAGADPPVQRGAIMGLLFLLATLLGRQGSAHVSLLAAAALMTALSPRLIQDVSFQLSFAATAGLVLLAPPLGRLLGQGNGAPGGLIGGLGGTLAMTLAAIAFTHPLIALYFGRLSLVAPLTNLLVVPLFPLLLVATALAALAGAVAAPLAEPLGWLAWAPLSYMLGVARLGAQMPFAALTVEGFGPLQAALAYGLLLAALAYLARRRPSLSARPTRAFGPSRPVPRLRLPSHPSRPPAWALALLAAAALGVWLLILAPTLVGGGRLTVSFLDVGQGDAILIESPKGHRVLVDGGPSGQALLGALDRRLPLWDRRLDLVALTHPQEDHLGGLVAALALYRVGAVMDNGGRGGSEAFLAYQKLRQERGRRHIQARAGQEVHLGGGARLSVLHPAGPQADDDNNGSLVLRVSLGEVSFLLTGDIEEPAERSLLAGGRPLKATVFKVPHHGAATSSSPPFLAAVRPALAVISVGQENPYGHPAPVALQRLDSAPGLLRVSPRRPLVLRTDRQGTVELATDGRRLWLRSQQPLCLTAGGCR